MSVTSIMSHSAACFKSHCVVATSISVFVLLCCPTFAICPITLLIGIRHFIVVCTMNCVSVVYVCVCCVMSSDRVWGVDDAVCLAVHSQRGGTLAQCPHLAAHINTMKLVEQARTHRL